MVRERGQVDRAKQFMPFAALKGYYELCRQQERILEPRRELTEEECRQLSETIAGLEKRDLVRVTRYDTDAYTVVEGAVSQVDTILRNLWVVRTCIPFDDIAAIEKIG